jgi:RNA polymerase sigma-B factor
VTPLPQTDQAELLRAYHQDGDTAARERLIQENLPLVQSIARRYAGRGERLEDLVQVASIGLIEAIDRFDSERGVSLQSYAIPTIVGEIKRHFRDRSWAVHVPRRLKELNLRLSRLVAELGHTLGRSPTVTELAAAAEVDEEEIIEALDAGQAYTADSLTAALDDDNEVDRIQLLATIEPAYDIAEDRHLLSSGLNALDGRERQIIHLRFFVGLTQSQIAGEVGVSQMHVSRLIRRALEKMRTEMQAE